MPAEGGPARRLTWLGPDTHRARLDAATAEIVFVTTQGQPFFRNHQRLHHRPRPAASPQLLALGQVNHLAFGPGGRTADRPQHRRSGALEALSRRHAPATSGSTPRARGTFRRMTELAGNLTSPMWIGERLYFLVRRRGRRQPLFVPRRRQRPAPPHRPRRVLRAPCAERRPAHRLPVRRASLWLFDPATDTTRELDIAHAGAPHPGGAPLRRRGASTSSRSTSHPAGHSLALVARGKLFTMALWEGAVRQLRRRPTAAAMRHGQWLGDGTSAGRGRRRVAARSGSSSSLPARRARLDRGTSATSRDCAPRRIGTRVALANHRNEVWIGDVATRRRSPSSTAATPAAATTSPGRPTAPGSPTPSRPARGTRAIKLLRGRRGHVARWSPSPSSATTAPAFDPDGRYLYFLSLRTFDPVYDSVQFELSFPRARAALPDRAAGRRAAAVRSRAARASQAAEAPGGDGGASRAPRAGAAARRPRRHRRARRRLSGRREPLRPDRRRGRRQGGLDGAATSSARTAAAATRKRRAGSRSSTSRPCAPRRWSTRSTPSSSPPTARTLRRARRQAAARDRRRPQARARPTRGRRAGGDAAVAQERLDRSRAAARLDRAAPRMAPDAARGLAPAARPVLGRATCRASTGTAVYRTLRAAARAGRDPRRALRPHLGDAGRARHVARLRDGRRSPQAAGGRARLPRAPTTRFDRSTAATRSRASSRGDPWDASADSPLNAIGVEAKVGERIVAVDGQRGVGDACRRRRCSSIRPAPRSSSTLKRDAAREAPTRDVARDDARRRGAGALSRMGRAATAPGCTRSPAGGSATCTCPTCRPAGFAEFHRYFGAECDRDALIVDVRYNRGGHVSQLLLEKVARRRIGYDAVALANAGAVSRRGGRRAGGRADQRACRLRRRHLLARLQADEHRPAGGHAHLGRRGRHLAAPRAGRRHARRRSPSSRSGSATSAGASRTTAPIPTIEVDNAPQDAAAGRDRQLEVAVATALAAGRHGAVAAERDTARGRCSPATPSRRADGGARGSAGQPGCFDGAQVGLERLEAGRDTSSSRPRR